MTILNNIRIFSNSFSDGVKTERIALKPYADEHVKILSGCATLGEYLCKSNAPSEYMKLIQLLPNESMKILDIGVGRGESALFLSSLGHKVFAVEPSEDFCQLLLSASSKFGMPVTVCQGVAEDLSQLGEADFDVIFFNSSLHHCDDPMAALRHSYGLLRPGGGIFLASELYIRPWVSKVKWYERLRTHPIEMGHYGGNEHAYYSWEYMSLLKKSGFDDMRVLPIAFSALDRLSSILSLRIRGVRVHGEAEFLLRAIYYIVLSRFTRLPFLFQFAARMSLVACNYYARKPI